MKELLNNLVKLQEIDTRILKKRHFIEKVPARIFEVDEPLKLARLELEGMKQKKDLLGKKKLEKERRLEDINEKIKKMKSRTNDIKTNKEYQAHLREIESFEKEISVIEEEILLLMDEADNLGKLQSAREEKVRAEMDRLDAIKKELDIEVVRYEKELAALNGERSAITASIDPDVYKLYMGLLRSGSGIAVAMAGNEVCGGCNMNMPPQLFAEVRKNEELIQCPQCHRILYCSGE
ncbi:MAG: hypothetical protein HZB33_12375 [Nitrospirae bacterium]|nr:hypothetical protein [Nitrospirota bacterium]